MKGSLGWTVGLLGLLLAVEGKEMEWGGLLLEKNVAAGPALIVTGRRQVRDEFNPPLMLEDNNQVGRLGELAPPKPPSPREYAQRTAPLPAPREMQMGEPSRRPPRTARVVRRGPPPQRRDDYKEDCDQEPVRRPRQRPPRYAVQTEPAYHDYDEMEEDDSYAQRRPRQSPRRYEYDEEDYQEERPQRRPVRQQRRDPPPSRAIHRAVNADEDDEYERPRRQQPLRQPRQQRQHRRPPVVRRLNKDEEYLEPTYDPREVERQRRPRRRQAGNAGGPNLVEYGHGRIEREVKSPGQIVLKPRDEQAIMEEAIRLLQGAGPPEQEDIGQPAAPPATRAPVNEQDEPYFDIYNRGQPPQQEGDYVEPAYRPGQLNAFYEEREQSTEKPQRRPAQTRSRPAATKRPETPRQRKPTADEDEGSGTLAVPFPAWMTFADRVRDAKSEDLAFNYPTTSLPKEQRENLDVSQVQAVIENPSINLACFRY